MVSTVKKKLCPTGNRTEFADYQAVLVNRIMIEDIILLKLSRVIYKVIVNGVSPTMIFGLLIMVFK